MIFKTIDNELKVFGKTILTTTEHLKNLETVSATVYNKNGKFTLEGLAVNTSQSVSNFTKLSNAFKVYNNNLNKSTQLQNAYIKAVGNQNNSLGNYLAGLNGAKASMGGYIKSLISAKAATIGLEIASTALNMALSLGVSLAISAIISQISKLITAQEDARKKSLELTNSYKEQKDSLDSQIEKYKELKESLDNGNLSTNEVRSVKEQLLEIQKSLIDSYGTEASNLDLVNGKYREQLGLLGDLSKEKANDYITENRDTFSDAKKELEKIRTYNVGNITSWSTVAPQTEDQKRLLDYISSYSDLLQLSYSGASHGNYSATTVDLSVKANVENADELMHQLATDLENYGKDNNIDVSGLLEGISEQLKKTWTDELSEYKTIYDEFMKAEVVRSDTLRPLYQQSIQAVEDYNNALSSGSGVDEAKAKLDSVKQSVKESTKELEGSETVFDDIFDSINQDAEAAYNLDQAFSNNKTVKDYAEQLKGLSDTDLKAINFDNANVEKGEEAFKNLMNILGLTKDQTQNLIDKLIELGYVQGELKEQTSDETPILSFTEAVSKVQELSKGFDQLDKIYADVLNKEEFDWSSILNNTSFTEAFGKTENVTEEYKAAYDDFIKTISNSPDDINKCQEAFNNLATEYIKNSGALDNLSESTKQATINMLEEMGIQNAEEIVTDLLTQKQAELEAQKYYTANATNDLKDATISEYLEFINEANVSDEAKKQLAKLALQKISTNNVKINTADDIDQIIALANAAGASAVQLAKLADAKAIIEKYNTTGLNGTTADLRKYEEAQALIKSIEEGTYKIESTLDASVFKAKYTGGSTTQKAADSAKKTADDLYKNLKEQIDAYMDYMEKSLDAGKIDYNTYCSSIKNYLDDLYNSGKLKAADYFNYVEKMLNKQKDIYDKVISAVVNRLEEEADKWQEKIDELESTNDKLNDNLSNMDSALDAIDRVYDNEIDRIQAIIDGLKDANDERDRTLALEKAKYELEKAYNQKVVKKYVEGRGYIYDVDYDAIKDAQSSYDDAELDLKTDELRKQIDALTNFKAQWADVKNAYQYNIDAMNATALFGSEYQKLILNNNILDVENFKNQYVNIQQQINSNEELIKSYNEKVEYYNKLKEQWQSLTSEYEKQMNAQYAAQVLGADWEAKVISGRVDVLNAFKNDYITIQQSIVDAQQAAAKAQMESLQALVNAEIAAANAIKQARKAAYDNSDVPSSPNINSNHKYTQSNINNMIKGGAPSSVVDAINKQQGTNLKGGTGNAQTYRTINDYKKAQAAQKKLANNIRQYSKGGIVKVDPNNILSDLAKRHGEDGGALVRNGEEILTEKESKDHRRGMDLFENFSNMLKNNKYLPQMVSAFNKPYNMDKTDNTSVIVTIGDINLQGVQNTDQLGEDIWKRLPSYITRKFNPKQR